MIKIPSAFIKREINLDGPDWPSDIPETGTSLLPEVKEFCADFKVSSRIVNCLWREPENHVVASKT